MGRFSKIGVLLLVFSFLCMAQWSQAEGGSWSESQNRKEAGLATELKRNAGVTDEELYTYLTFEAIRYLHEGMTFNEYLDVLTQEGFSFKHRRLRFAEMGGSIRDVLLVYFNDYLYIELTGESYHYDTDGLAVAINGQTIEDIEV